MFLQTSHHDQYTSIWQPSLLFRMNTHIHTHTHKAYSMHNLWQSHTHTYHYTQTPQAYSIHNLIFTHPHPPTHNHKLTLYTICGIHTHIHKQSCTHTQTHWEYTLDYPLTQFVWREGFRISYNSLALAFAVVENRCRPSLPWLHACW